MSCCSGKCGCGSSCSCGSSCNGCGKYPDLETSSATTAVILFNNSMPKRNKYDEGMEGSFVAEGGQGCKCGGNCKCDPCNC